MTGAPLGLEIIPKRRQIFSLTSSKTLKPPPKIRQLYILLAWGG